LPFVAHATYEIQDTDINGFPTIAMDDPFDRYHYGGEHENAHKYQALTQQSLKVNLNGHLQYRLLQSELNPLNTVLPAIGIMLRGYDYSSSKVT
jgi:hypothetical protein